MLSDDVYRSQLTTAFAALKRLAGELSDAAQAETAETRDFVRLALLPKAAGACAVEIMLRADQLYDIAIGNEFYEDCKVERFDLFQPLVTAITRGDVIQRHHISAATGTERSIETIVTLPGGEIWRKGHVHGSVAPAIPDAATLLKDRTFLPYRR